MPDLMLLLWFAPFLWDDLMLKVTYLGATLWTEGGMDRCIPLEAALWPPLMTPGP